MTFGFRWEIEAEEEAREIATPCITECSLDQTPFNSNTSLC